LPRTWRSLGQISPDGEQELEAIEASLRSLHAYLSDVLEVCPNLELYACWSGGKLRVRRFGWVVDPEGNRLELWEPPRLPRS
jgi:hypothetical protein